jgi:hypothetical protein
LDALALLAKHAALTGPLTLSILDSDPDIIGGLLPEAGGSDLVASLREGTAKSAKHPDGYELIAADHPYPVDLILGEGFARFVEALKSKGARVFLFTPVVSHPPATSLVCAACDGTVLLVEPARTTASMIGQAVEEIKSAGGAVVGFITLG